MENVWFWNMMYLILLHMLMICYSLEAIPLTWQSQKLKLLHKVAHLAANAKANVQTVAANTKKKDVYVQLNAILVQGMIHVLMQSKKVEQAEELSKRRN